MKNLKNFISSFLFLLVSISTVTATNNLTKFDQNNQTLTDFTDNKPAFENVSICRIQLKVKTNGMENANTDNPVWVTFNEKDEPFYLNLSKNDRERNQTDIYDVLSPNINKIKDIRFINIGLEGNDGWNIREITLLVNGVSIYKKTYSSKGLWLDGNDSKRKPAVFIPRNVLRKYPNFKYNSVTNNIWKGPSMIQKAFITSLVESAVGNSLYNVKKVSWGKKQGKTFINSKRINNNTLRFDLDLSYEINNAPDVEIDVDFDLVFTCKNGVIQTKVKNYKSKSYGTMSFLVDAMGKLKKHLYSGCTQISDPTYAVLCAGGVWGVGKLLDFNFSYDGPGNVGVSKECTGALKLDQQGNLILGKKNPPLAKSKKPIIYSKAIKLHTGN